MAMSQGDGVDLDVLHLFQQRQTLPPDASGMGPGVQQHVMALQRGEPATGADAGVGVQMSNAHGVPSHDPPGGATVEVRWIEIQSPDSRSTELVGLHRAVTVSE
jgi:hypothetical protein